MRSALRAILVALLAVAIGGSAAAECATGELSPTQHECCAAMKGDCAAGRIQMDCCPTEQHSQSRLITTATKPVVHAPVVLACLPALTLPATIKTQAAAFWASTEHRPKQSQRPTFLVLSVLLI
jgi:hypothetical protein